MERRIRAIQPFAVSNSEQVRQKKCIFKHTKKIINTSLAIEMPCPNVSSISLSRIAYSKPHEDGPAMTWWGVKGQGSLGIL